MEQPQVSARASRKVNGKPPAPAGPELNLSKLLQALQSVRDGDFSVRLASDQTGLAGKVADTFNEIVSANQRLARELERVGQIVGKDGKTRHRMSSERRSGAWGAMEQSVNTLIDDLLWPTTEVTRTISAVAKGDLQQAMSLEVDGRALKGEFLRSATIVNTMIAQMSAFTSVHQLDEVPVAAASVAQVHRGRLRDESEVAIKVLRPNVRAQVERDGSLLLFAAKLLGLHPTIRLSDPVGFTREFVLGLSRQTDLRIEGANYAQFRENFKNEPRIAFPRVFNELTCEKVLVMEFVRGKKVDALGPGDHSALAKALREAAFKMYFDDGFVHADMHPGNMVKRDDGVLVLLDVGLATKIAPNTHEMFIDMVKCLAMGAPEDMMEHFRRFHVYMGDVDWDKMLVDLKAFAMKFRSQDVSQLDYGGFVNELLALGRRYHVRPMSDLALVIVGTVTAQGIGKMLAPQVNDFVEMSKFLIPILVKRGERVPDSEEAKQAREAMSRAVPA